MLKVEHESVVKFIEFAHNKKYLKYSGHRIAALEDSRLLPMTENKLKIPVDTEKLQSLRVWITEALSHVLTNIGRQKLATTYKTTAVFFKFHSQEPTVLKYFFYCIKKRRAFEAIQELSPYNFD